MKIFASLLLICAITITPTYAAQYSLIPPRLYASPVLFIKNVASYANLASPQRAIILITDSTRKTRPYDPLQLMQENYQSKLLLEEMKKLDKKNCDVRLLVTHTVAQRARLLPTTPLGIPTKILPKQVYGLTIAHDNELQLFTEPATYNDRSILSFLQGTYPECSSCELITAKSWRFTDSVYRPTKYDDLLKQLDTWWDQSSLLL